MKKISVTLVSFFIIFLLLAGTVFVMKKRNPDDYVLRQPVFIENLTTQEACETYDYTWDSETNTCIE